MIIFVGQHTHTYTTTTVQSCYTKKGTWILSGCIWAYYTSAYIRSIRSTLRVYCRRVPSDTGSVTGSQSLRGSIVEQHAIIYYRNFTHADAWTHTPYLRIIWSTRLLRQREQNKSKKATNIYPEKNPEKRISECNRSSPLTNKQQTKLRGVQQTLQTREGCLSKCLRMTQPNPYPTLTPTSWRRTVTLGLPGGRECLLRCVPLLLVLLLCCVPLPLENYNNNSRKIPLPAEMFHSSLEPTECSSQAGDRFTPNS